MHFWRVVITYEHGKYQSGLMGEKFVGVTEGGRSEWYAATIGVRTKRVAVGKKE
jgi:hypothetical protein